MGQSANYRTSGAHRTPCPDGETGSKLKSVPGAIFGVQDALNPADNVQGAVKFLKWLQGFWAKRIPDENERLKFILASYNTGAGHVEDAQRLTEKYGGNPQVWEDVSYWLLQKSTQQYSSDAVVKFGFCRGLETVNYVSHIFDRFDHYRQFVVA